MKYINLFKTHASYEEKLNVGEVDISYCEDVKDIHYNPYNTVEFYVGEVTEPQTVKIYTDLNTSVDVQVSEGNKWYTYLLPKDKGLCMIEGDSVKKVVVKADFSYEGIPSYPQIIIPSSTVEASFKGSKLNITDIKGIFQYCSGLTSLDLSGWDTSNVTNMNTMFQDCTSLTSLDVSKFNTSKVTKMNGMFNGCSGLTSLDLRNFNTSKVTSMCSMFNGCRSLKSLDVSSFNTSNVTDMAVMFAYCNNLTSLDVSSFNTSNVTDMGYMFSGCTNLTSLDVSNFDTSKVTCMIHMFEDCSKLTSLDLSGWVINDATDTGSMFNACDALEEIKMVGCTQDTINKIKAQLTTDLISIDKVNIITE